MNDLPICYPIKPIIFDLALDSKLVGRGMHLSLTRVIMSLKPIEALNFFRFLFPSCL